MSNSVRSSSLNHRNPRNQLSRRRLLQGTAALGLASSISLSGLASLNVGAAQDSSDGLRLLRIGGGQAASWVRNFNPLVPDALRPTQFGVFEPLFVYATSNGEITPWLATDWSFNDDSTELTFNIREGVSWSDGEPFTADDVAFTFNLLKENTALSGSGGVRGILKYVDRFEAPDSNTFVVTFTQPFTPALYPIGGQSIVPQHVWQEIEDPVTFANENPVGTGPFTEVGAFRPQYYELLRNPNYWQQDKPSIEGIAYPSYASNDAGTLGLINDEFDWMGMFIPDIDNTYVAEDPEHFHYWFPTTGASVGLFFNHTRPPFESLELRQAMSMAIDRDQIVSIAMFDYALPADATGMSDTYRQWKSQEVMEAGKELVTLNVEQANQLLDDAGFTRDGDVRVTPDGQSLEFELIMPSGWSDWMQVGQLLGQQMAAIGVNVIPRGIESTTWTDSTLKGDFDLSLGFSAVTASPFDHFQNLMSNDTVMPVGESASVNWHRFGNDQVTEWLGEFAASSDESEQMELVHQMQQAFLEHWPVAPIYLSPRWGEHNTRHFEGFPSEENPYANTSPGVAPEFLLVLTEVTPVDEN